MPLKGEFVINQDPEIEDVPAAATARPVPPAVIRHKVGLFSTYAEFPDGITFQNQEPNEEVELLIRKDFITNAPWIAVTILLGIIPFIVPFVFPIAAPFLHLSTLIIMVILAAYYLALFGYVLLNYSTWYFQVGLVTNIRLVDVNVPNILSREISETFLDLVKDVSYTQKGLLQSFFDYGDVNVQTNAPVTTIIYDSVPQPSHVSKIITDLVEGKNRE